MSTVTINCLIVLILAPTCIISTTSNQLPKTPPRILADPNLSPPLSSWQAVSTTPSLDDHPDHARNVPNNDEEVWFDSIDDEQHLINQFSIIIRDLHQYQQSRCMNQFVISISNYDIETIQLYPFHSINAGLSILTAMHKWYGYELRNRNWDAFFIQSLQIPPAKIAELIRIFNASRWYNSYKITQENASEIRVLLAEIFGNFPNNIHNLIYTWMYAIPELSWQIGWISEYKLELLKQVGVGRQAKVYSVRDVETHQHFALKMFEHHEEFSARIEESILIRIENEIYNNPDFGQFDEEHTRLQIPRIITKYGIQAYHDNAILMELIDAVPFHSGLYFAPNNVKRMRDQLGFTLSLINKMGIGHFDIMNGNIMLDIHDSFWLHDFGLGINIGINQWKTSNIWLPLVGSWRYYSFYLYQLNNMLSEWKLCGLDVIPEDERETVIRYIAKSDMYSLEAMILHYTILQNERVTRAVDICNAIWRRTDGKFIHPLIYGKLMGIWKYRTNIVEALLKNESNREVYPQSMRILMYQDEIMT